MLNYKKLEAWSLSMKLVKEIYQMTKFYPSYERFGLTGQTNRAAVSIPSNIAEGMGRNHKKDTIQFLHVSRGSAYELETLICITQMINLIDEQVYQRLSKKIESTLRLIKGLINYLEKE